jgi:hypothetical protein
MSFIEWDPISELDEWIYGSKTDIHTVQLWSKKNQKSVKKFFQDIDPKMVKSQKIH